MTQNSVLEQLLFLISETVEIQLKFESNKTVISVIFAIRVDFLADLYK